MSVIIKRLRYFNHTAHKELWNWLAENPGRGKVEWPEWGKYPLRNNSYCFACETVASVMLIYPYNPCFYCPLTWDTKKCDIKHYLKTGLYRKWYECFASNNRRRQSVLATQIRDLPLRPDRPEDPFITVVI